VHTIRPERESDAAEIRAMTRAAFGSSGDSGDTGVSEVALIDLLRSRGKASISLVATEVDERVVGHVLFSPVTIDPAHNKRRILGMAPLGVHPDVQGRGIGSALVLTGLEDCRTAGYDAVVVLGEPSYYGQFGFEKASSRGLSNEYGADEAFMVVGLRPGALDGLTGLATYGPEFGEVGA
jgi:putative acetyltransferase